MAEKRNIAIETEAKTEVKEEQKAEQSVNDYMNELVEYTAVYDGDKYKDDIYVGVNDKDWLIKRGVTVKIPRYVYNVIKAAEEQRIAAMRYKEEATSNRNRVIASL